jgi:large subunit ribosomal protein L30
MPSARKPGAPGRTKKSASRGAATPKGRTKRAAATKARPADVAGETAAAAPAPTATAAARPARRRPAGGKTITIVQYASGIGCPKRQKRVLRSLGLRHPHHTVVRTDNAAVRGMVNAIRHLARIVEDTRGA